MVQMNQLGTSHSLSLSEQGYSQLKKEALAVVFGLRELDKHCSIVTDHKPLLGLLGENKCILQLTAALILAGYGSILE